ncbi:translation initiation factor IF-2 [Candidatus Gottesmanbacteria bacterium]|nr:translation initiation factor IF-2 [Candidatus Gottesmanbacteria bacterium]
MVKKSKTQYIATRAPIVTILGHVDHGKTSLLDTIRKTNIAQREHGGITQHIGAYQIETPKGKITFIDTPGHQAFAKMRGRGADVSDIAVLVVAANDGVMPQTIESINLIQNAQIPAIVAINKIDLPDINIDKIKKQLTKHGLNLEEYGGEIPVIPLSAKTGEGVEKLLEMILLLSELNQVQEDMAGKFKAVVIESTLSKSRGAVATIIIRSGKLSIGEEVVCEDQTFKVRAFINWLGQNKTQVIPGDPTEILGWQKVPLVGSALYKKSAVALGQKVEEEITPAIKTEIITTPSSEQEIEQEKINFIIKSDNFGTLEAILGSLPKNAIVIASGAGQISESDILLAKTTKAIVIGFNMKIADSVVKLADSEKVILKTYNIIYELLEEIDDVVEAALTGNLVEILGEAKIMAVFTMKDQVVAGVKISSGRIARGDKVKIVRKEVELGRSRIKSLRHGKEDITKAEQGMEAGVILADNITFLTGDSIISIG